MREVSALKLLFDLGVSIQRKSYTGSADRTRWMNISCPFAPFTHAGGSDTNPSFGITLSETDRSYYKCLSCGMKGSLAQLPVKLGSYRKIDYSKLRHWAELEEMQATALRPVVDWEAGVISNDDKQRRSKTVDVEAAREYPRALGIKYLRERKIKYPTPITLDLRYDNYQHRVLFPCFDSSGDFCGFTGRSVRHPRTYSKQNPKVRDYLGLDKRSLFLDLPWARTRDGIKVVVEGLFDFANLVQCGYLRSKAILGTALTPEKINILISEGDPVYFFMDNDLAGWQSLFGTLDEDGERDTENAWADNLYMELPVWVVPYPRNFDGTDPGSLSKQQVDAAIKRAWLYTGQPSWDEAGEPTFRTV